MTQELARYHNANTSKGLCITRVGAQMIVKSVAFWTVWILRITLHREN